MSMNPNSQSVSLHYAAGAFNSVANGGFDSDGVVGLSTDEAREAARTILFDENGQARSSLSDEDRALGELMATIAIGGTNGMALINDTNGDGQMSFFELADVADANNPAGDRGLMIDADDVVTHYGADAVAGGVEITYEALGGTPSSDDGTGGTNINDANIGIQALQHLLGLLTIVTNLITGSGSNNTNS